MPFLKPQNIHIPEEIRTATGGRLVQQTQLLTYASQAVVPCGVFRVSFLLVLKLERQMLRLVF